MLIFALGVRSNQRDKLEMVAINQLVPANQLVQKMKDTIEFSFIFHLEKYDIKKMAEETNLIVIC
jgi:hypothetical protein